MLRLIIFAIIAVLMATRASAQIPFSGEDLLLSCSASGATSERHPCQWYLKGFIDGQGTPQGSTYSRTQCLPAGFTIDQLRRIVVKWMNDHPEKLHLSVADVVRGALEQAFPCKK